MLIFDIETGPLPDVDLRRIYGEFDPASVKLGNLKDEEKIAAKIEEARVNGFAEFKANAALSATTGCVLCVGYYDTITEVAEVDDGENDDGDTREAKILGSFWKTFAACCKEGRQLAGVNIFDFDLPFIMRRSWILGVAVPSGVLANGRYWHSAFVDLRRTWLCGQSPVAGVRSSFDELAKAFGTAGKPTGISGGDFAELWERDRATAIEYVKNDVKQPAKWAEMMGIC